MPEPLTMLNAVERPSVVFLPPWTVSNAPKHKIIVFVSILTALGTILNIMTSISSYPQFYFSLGLIPSYLAAVTMGPFWGAIVGFFSTYFWILSHLPLGTMFIASTDLAFYILTFTGYALVISCFSAFPGVILGFLVRRIRPIWCLIALEAVIAFFYIWFGFLQWSYATEAVRRIVWLNSLLGTSLHIITIISSWVLTSHPWLHRFYPGYIRPSYKLFWKEREENKLL